MHAFTSLSLHLAVILIVIISTFIQHRSHCAARCDLRHPR